MKGKQKLIKGKPKKGEPRTGYEEQKERVNLSLTPTAILFFDAIAERLNISRSEVLERIAREKLS